MRLCVSARNMLCFPFLWAEVSVWRTSDDATHFFYLINNKSLSTGFKELFIIIIQKERGEALKAEVGWTAHSRWEFPEIVDISEELREAACQYTVRRSATRWAVRAA